MVNVAHDGYNRRTGQQVFFCIFLIFLMLHFHLLFHINELHIKPKLTGYQFNYFRIKTLVDRYHDTQAHTLANYLCKTYIHQVSQFAYADKLCYLQFIIIGCATHCFRHFLSFLTAVLSFQALAFTAPTRKFGLRFLYLPLNFFFVNQFIFPAATSATAVVSAVTTTTTVATTLTESATTLSLVITFLIDEYFPLGVFFLNRDTFTFLLLIFYGSCIGMYGELNFSEDFGACQLFYLYIFYHRRSFFFLYRRHHNRFFFLFFHYLNRLHLFLFLFLRFFSLRLFCFSYRFFLLFFFFGLSGFLRSG